MESNKIEFTVIADDKNALIIALNEINLQSGSNYVLIKFVRHEVGLATISVDTDKIKPEFLFLMGRRYEIFREKPKLNF